MAITREVWTDGSTVLNNARLQALYASIESAWALDTWVPAWTATTTNPVKNNGTIVGSYVNVGGKLVLFAATITAGTTTTYGTGNYILSLPVSANAGFAGAITVFATDASAGGAVYNGVGYIDTSTTMLMLTQHDSAAGNYTPTVPFTFANGDTIRVYGAYFRL